jgi:hypothetical protein
MQQGMVGFVLQLLRQAIVVVLMMPLQLGDVACLLCRSHASMSIAAMAAAWSALHVCC